MLRKDENKKISCSFEPKGLHCKHLDFFEALDFFSNVHQLGKNNIGWSVSKLLPVIEQLLEETKENY